MRGQIDVTDDDKDIKSISDDGYLEINKTVFGSKRTLVIHTDNSGEVSKKDLDEARGLAREVDLAESPVNAIVSVLMLREGWDLPEVGIILLLRKFSSRVYGQQVIGRGLRRVRGKRIDPSEPQICAVVDHPKLEHQWLWDMFGSKVRQNVLIDQTFDETEDLAGVFAAL